MSKNQVRTHFRLELFKELLDGFTTVREKAFLEFLGDNRFAAGIEEEASAARQGLASSFRIRAKHDPGDIAVLVPAQQTQNGTSASNLNVIRVCSETQD